MLLSVGGQDVSTCNDGVGDRSACTWTVDLGACLEGCCTRSTQRAHLRGAFDPRRDFSWEGNVVMNAPPVTEQASITA